MEKVEIATLRNEPQRNFSDRSNRSSCDSTQTHTQQQYKGRSTNKSAK